MELNTNSSRDLATGVFKAISTFAAEFEGAKTEANVIYMNEGHFFALKEHFPYIVYSEQDSEPFKSLCYNGKVYRVLITDKDTVGMAFSFHTDYVLEYNKEIEVE